MSNYVKFSQPTEPITLTLHAYLPRTLRPPRVRALGGDERAVGVPSEMLLGTATILALVAGSSASAAKPSKPSKQPKQIPDVVKSRILLIDLYCNTDAKEYVLINTNPTEKVAAAKRAPCQARARDTLGIAAPIAPH
jgi:hypothetical protein